MNLGWTEIVLIAVVLLFLFGPKRLPAMGKSIGEAIRGFKKGLDTSAEEDLKSAETRIVSSNQDQLPPAADLKKSEDSVKDKSHTAN